jgi:hypothetical protein
MTEHWPRLAIHPLSEMGFNEDGPDRLTVGAFFDEAGLTPSQWIVDVTIYPREELVNKDDSNQWDEQDQCVIPESSWAIPPEQARRLAAMLIKAAEIAELFQAGDD